MKVFYFVRPRVAGLAVDRAAGGEEGLPLQRRVAQGAAEARGVELAENSVGKGILWCSCGIL